jgi:hypothetical protein
MSVARIRERIPRQERAALEMLACRNSDSVAYRPRRSLVASAADLT